LSQSAEERNRLLRRSDELSRRSVELAGKREFRIALPMAEEALKIRHEVVGDDNKYTAWSYGHLGILYFNLGEREKARTSFEQTLRINRKLFGEEHAATAQWCVNLGLLHLSLREYATAETYFQEALKIRRKVLGVDNADTAQTYDYLGLLELSMGHYRRARESYFEKALEIRRKVLGEEHADTATSYNNLGEAFKGLADYKNARVNFEQALNIRRKVLGEEHADTATSYNALGVTLTTLKDYKDARKNLEQTIRIRRKVLGEEHPDTVASNENLAAVLFAAGDNEGAQALREQALGIRRKISGDERPIATISAVTFDFAFRSVVDAAKARTNYERALNESRGAQGENADTAASYNGLGLALQTLGDYEAARKSFERALQIRTKVLGEEHRETAASFGNLGNVVRVLADYPAARKDLEECLRIRRKVLGEEDADTAASYNDLGLVLGALGDHLNARKDLERALEIRRKVLGEDHVDTATSYINVAMVLIGLHQYRDARTYCEKSLKIYQKAVGDDDPRTAGAYVGMGMLCSAVRDFDTAGDHFEKAIKIVSRVMGEDHPSTAPVHQATGDAAREMFGYETARAEYEHALTINRKAFGEAHPSTIALYNSLMLGEIELANSLAASKWIDRQRRGSRSYVAHVLPSLTEREQQQFLRENDRNQLELSLSFAFLFREEESIRSRSAAWLLNSKGVGHQALAEQVSLARDTTDSKLASLLQELTEVRGKLSQLSIAVPRPEGAAEHEKELAQLISEEADLSRQFIGARGGAGDGDGWAELDEVRRALPKDSILIDIARFRLFPLGGRDESNRKSPWLLSQPRSWKQQTMRQTFGIVRMGMQHQLKKTQRWHAARYAAWVIPAAGNGDVRLVDLGEADAIDVRIEALRKLLGSVHAKDSTLLTEGEPKADAELRATFQQLADQIWKPLAPHVGQARQLFLSPDGALWLVPWAAIPVEENKFLIEQVTINYLISGRDVVVLARKAVADMRKPVLFADPSFDLSPEEVTAASKAVLRSHPPVDREQRSTNATTLLPRAVRLPSTAVEAEAIKPNLQKLTGQAPILYRDIYALESVAKALNRPKLAIFSTHGFFLPDQEARQDEKSSQLALAGNESRAVRLAKDVKPFENPLLRCGLLFAGCNPRNEGQAGSGDDGVLTGMEIVGIDFRGTELVVLSACETGVGAVNNGEGVAGLRQAFQLAGAEAVGATLWQINDLESARLMNDFFANLAAGQAKGEALRNAQLKRIESRRERYGAAHPYFWAAYTLTGR
jgi:CHAT domain-containing protein/Tfp pilus assembly protein PilF